MSPTNEQLAHVILEECYLTNTIAATGCACKSATDGYYMAPPPWSSETRQLRLLPRRHCGHDLLKWVGGVLQHI